MNQKSSFADHFSTKSAQYSRYRPGYPPELFAFLASHAPAQQWMWDVATGSGQSAVAASRYFANVIASDASFNQVRNAQTADNVYYLACLAEHLAMKAHSLDLITVAQALHWFDLDSFYAEVKRALKPQGLIAVWTYNLIQVNPAVDEIVHHLYSHILGEYWAFERKLVETGYRDLVFPFEEQPLPKFSMTLTWNIDHLLGYLSTWSAAKTYQQKNSLDPLDLVRADLHKAWGIEHEQQVSWPLKVKLGINRLP